MAPSSAAAAAATRLKLISVASFGLITGACVLVGYYLLRRIRKSSGHDSTETRSDEATERDKRDSEESKHTDTVSEITEETSTSKEHEATTDTQDLHPKSGGIGTNEAKDAESKKIDVVETGRDRDLLRDVGPSTSSHISKTNDALSKDLERPIVNGDTPPGKHKVFSTGITHFLDEANGELSSDFGDGTHKPQKQDTWSETVIVGGKENSTNENEKSEHRSQVDERTSDRSSGSQTERDLDATKRRKQSTNTTAAHEESIDQNSQLPDARYDRSSRANNEGSNDASINTETENFTTDQSAAADEIVKGGNDDAASFAQGTTFQGVIIKEHADTVQQLAIHDPRSTKSSSLPSPLTPPPDSGTPRRQRTRGRLTTPVASDQAQSVVGQAVRSRRRWPPLEDKTVENVELDASSQQASWTTSRSSSGSSSQSSMQSPWTSTRAMDEAIFGDRGEKVEFDDNFVDTVSQKSETEAPPSSTQGSRLNVSQRSCAAKDISSLLHAPSECVLERKPLISEDEEDEESADPDGRHHITDQSRKKVEQKTQNVASEQTQSKSAQEGKKLVEMDENCIDSLTKLAKESEDTAAQLASLRALVNLSWTQEKHHAYTPVIDQLFANVDSRDDSLQLESLRVLANLSKNPEMVPYLMAAKAPGCLLKMLTPELDDEVLTIWLSILDDVLWASKEMCLTYASLPTDRRAASPETVYTGLYGLKNSRILKSRIFVLSRHKSQQVTYLASRIYSCLTS